MSDSHNRRNRSKRSTARQSNLKKNKSRKTVNDRRMVEKHNQIIENTSPFSSADELRDIDLFNIDTETSVTKEEAGGYISLLNDYTDSQEKSEKHRQTVAERRKRRTKARNHRPWVLKLIFAFLMILAGISIIVGTLLVVEPDAIKDRVYDIQRWSYPDTYSNYVNAYSQKYGVDPDLVYAVIYTESHFDAEAESPAGAVGLMQITPICFEFVKGELKGEDKDNYTLKDLKKPGVSIKYGTFFLGYLLDHYEKEETAVAAYNAGFSTVDIWLEDKAISPDGKTLKNIPYEETANYVVKVENTKKKYKELY